MRGPRRVCFPHRRPGSAAVPDDETSARLARNREGPIRCGGLALQAKPPKRNGARVGGFAHMRTGATPQSRLSTTRRPRFAKSESIAPSSSWLAFWIRWNVSPTVIVGGSLAAGAQKGLLPARNLAGVAIQQQDFTCRAHPLMRGCDRSEPRAPRSDVPTRPELPT